MTWITELSDEQAFAEIRRRAPSAREVTIWFDLDGHRIVKLDGATDDDRRRVHNWLGLHAPKIGPTEVRPAFDEEGER